MDPLGELGPDGSNIYKFARNAPTYMMDVNGLATVRIEETNGNQTTLVNPSNNKLREILRNMKNKCIKKIEIAGHGAPFGIQISSENDNGLYASQHGGVVYSDEPSLKFSDSVRHKMADGGTIILNGCNTAREFGIMEDRDGEAHFYLDRKDNISQRLSRELVDIEVSGNITYAVGLGHSLLPFMFKEDHIVGLKRTYKNGKWADSDLAQMARNLASTPWLR
jgi:hypothetical protein